MKGCNIREGQGKKLFSFPKDPERRFIWVSRTGRRFWQPTVCSCICEDHFAASQWEIVRADGSRVLRHLAVPTTSLPVENTFQNLTAQINRLSDDHSYASNQPKLSKPIQAAKSQIIARTSNIAVESVRQDANQDDLDPLSILANICATYEAVHIPQVHSPSTASTTIIQDQVKNKKEEIEALQIQELQNLIKKQKEEIEALKHDNKLFLFFYWYSVCDLFLSPMYDTCDIENRSLM
ncbi:PREDICTED: uncharacterized protein LOC105556618 [Vollenhovia emeryi]|uniref:uncharacterized protein LOC105556618 n=1 Tax=Vollenhovia emeryi TaxID=411798 RepID=UPI0005F3E562|nr:PREDICTED: uncharacterized protein LOC105556618 [Vollenhovia emeryi]